MESRPRASVHRYREPIGVNIRTPAASGPSPRRGLAGGFRARTGDTILKCQFTRHRRRPLCVAAASIGAALLATTAMADVTETKAITLNMAIAKINSTDTERYAGDKKRTDTETRCEGFLLSMICGDIKGGEITRLDKDLAWTLEPAKKRYLEKPFPTPEQRAEAQRKVAEMMEKLKSCPTAPRQTAPETSKCEMSPPKIDIKKTDETAIIVGHEARRTALTLTQTCTNKETGDACDIILGLDSWLTQDEIAGADAKRAFLQAYAKRLGLDETVQMMKPQMQTLLAPYADAMRQASSKAGDLKGYALKTTISIAMGGEHCAAAKAHAQQGSSGDAVANATEAATGAAASSAAGAAGGAAGQAVGQSMGGGIGGAIAGSAAGAFGSKLVSGFFGKKPAAPPAPTKADASTTVADQTGKPIRLVELTMETTAISSDPVSADQFNIPADWKLEQPKPQKEHEVQCPPEGK
jgi:hypothetical protein